MQTEVNKENSPILTHTEREVIEWIGHGLSQKEIALKMNVERKTIDKHIDNIKKKYKCSKATELMGLYTAIKKSKKFDVNLLRQYGLQIFFILITVCDSSTPRP